MDKMNNKTKWVKTKDNILSDDHIKLLVKRKADFISGKTTSRPWSEIKKQYE